MCGIFGYIGEREAKEEILRGLKFLEYRGYDSSGIALYNKNAIDVYKKSGRISALEEVLKDCKSSSGLGIGHTRWATHGRPSDDNAHPFLAMHSKFAVVHNGIIKNYLEIKEELEKSQYRFFSQTDSEVVANLIDSLYTGDTVQAILKAAKRLRGSFALGILSLYDEGTVFAVKKDSPLILGLGKDENYISSDINTLQNFVDKVVVLENGQVAVIKKDAFAVKNFAGKEINYKTLEVKRHESIELEANAEPFMIREIREIPSKLADTLSHYEKHDILSGMDKDFLLGVKRIYITACGTALHAGICARAVLRKYCRLDVISDFASEFKHENYIVDKNTLTIMISQSGETADTLAAVDNIKSKGGKVLTVTNVPTSTLANIGDFSCPTFAGPEISVASTKAYNCQLLTLYLFVLKFALLRKEIEKPEYDKKMKALSKLQKLAQKTLENCGAIEELAKAHFDKKSVYFIGRGMDCYSAMEGALKLKEISYINSEAYASGELKHGTLALIEPGVLVVSCITQNNLLHKSINALSEVRARGAEVIVVTQFDDNFLSEHASSVVTLPKLEEDFMPILTVIPLQLFAYYMARCRGCDIDKPRNLAKSVTVE